MDNAAANHSSTEWTIPDPTIDVRQGDFLLSRDPITREIVDICLVITADCDISQSKFGKQLACLKIITHEEYIKTIWATKKFDKIYKNEVEKVQAKVNKWNKQRTGGGGEIAIDVMIDWIKRSQPLEICKALEVPDTNVKKEVAAIEVLKNCLCALDGNKNGNKLTHASFFKAEISGKDPETCFAEYLQNAQQEPMPDDIFFLPSLPQLDVGPAVILLREVVGVCVSNLCYRLSEANSLNSYMRIGRLNPTFKYAVSQAFGMLYSRIGLPREFEDRCREAVSKIGTLKWEGEC